MARVNCLVIIISTFVSAINLVIIYSEVLKIHTLEQNVRKYPAIHANYS